MDGKGHGHTGQPTRVQSLTDSTRKKTIIESQRKCAGGKKKIAFYLTMNQLHEFQQIKDDFKASSHQDVVMHLMDL